MKMHPLKIAAFAALPCLGLAAAAEAQVSDVSTVQVVQNLDQYLQIAELQVFSGSTNVALSGTPDATKSDPAAFETTLQNAIDNDTDGGYEGGFDAGSIYHGTNQTAGILYELDLASPVTVDSVTVWGRTDCCGDRDDDLTLRLFDASGTLLSSTDFGIAGDSATVEPQPIPEPAGLALLGFAGLGLLSRRRKA